MDSTHMNAAELSNASARRNDAPDVQRELLEFSRTVGAWQTPEAVELLRIHLLGPARLGSFWGEALLSSSNPPNHVH
jgi:hypothetical protein